MLVACTESQSGTAKYDTGHILKQTMKGLVNNIILFCSSHEIFYFMHLPACLGHFKQ